MTQEEKNLKLAEWAKISMMTSLGASRDFYSSEYSNSLLLDELAKRGYEPCLDAVGSGDEVKWSCITNINYSYGGENYVADRREAVCECVLALIESKPKGE